MIPSCFLSVVLRVRLPERGLLPLRVAERLRGRPARSGWCRQSGSPGFTLEKRYLRKDGSLVWVEPFASLQRDAAGTPTYLLEDGRQRGVGP